MNFSYWIGLIDGQDISILPFFLLPSFSEYSENLLSETSRSLFDKQINRLPFGDEILMDCGWGKY
jgi:hypothetical protein